MACLDSKALEALVEVGRRIERAFGAHQDVEWALTRGRSLPDGLFVLQARPVTAVPERAPKLSGSALSLVLSTFGAVPTKDERD
jgi:phosphoenolpyruvate synthase/pyruvate phosphate dikinase